ncbi:MAG: MBL fold metallo-hydrolase [Gemmatimonadales bacterium]|nr:MAG: MBL fold metallo-hydrolase [Gemmatimonadales bacterium]
MTQDQDSKGSQQAVDSGDPPGFPTAAGLPLVRSFELGALRVHAIEAGLQRLDGGAMFGVVPRPLWEKRIPPDARNRIPLALRCLLVEAPEALILIDTGVGNKGDDSFRQIYGIENEGDPAAGAPTRLELGIREAGHEPSDVDIVLMTHLHFDHAGGGTMRRDDGEIVPSFPGARYVVHEDEFRFAGSPNERIRASYLRENLEPISRFNLWDFVGTNAEITGGIHLRHTPGHTPHHHSVVLESGGERACFLADLCPTTAHLPLPWIMGYDLEPLVTLESKREMWERALHEDWLLIFEHDPVVPWGRLAENRRSLREE